ncbi:unnamed protein product [Rotaria sp. Silwood1]|nr:unnamed protein product [Rotaria sp. Silwood1]CAF4939729.1 unnamed protein product [Rotaria sp. Silwood1]
MEVIDSGMASSDNSINASSADDTLSTTIAHFKIKGGYPATTYSCGNSWSETISQSTTMDFSTSVSDMNNISNNISLVSICETRSSSIRSSHTYTGPFVLTKNYDDNYESPYSIMNSYSTTAPEDMFPAYQSIFSDDEKDDFKTESIIEEVKENDHPSLSALNTTSPMIDYNVCCLSPAGSLNDCGPRTARRDWPVGCVSFEYLNNISAEEYLIRKGIMLEQQRPYLKLNEKDLIANRLQLKNIPVHNNIRICPKHRNTFGIGWCDRDNVCHHPGHDVQQHLRPSDCRRANIIMCSKIDRFPIEGPLCSKHRKMLHSNSDSEMYSHPSCDTFDSAYEIEDTREHMNNILNVAGLSPVKSQITKTLKQQSKSSVRRLLSKLKRGTQPLQSKLAETSAPGEGDELLRMANLSETSTQPNIDMQVENNEMVENIKKIYNLYTAQKMPFAEQVRLLTLLPRAWSTKLFEILGSIKPSSQHAVSGLDEFVTEGIETWKTISNIVSNLSIPQVDRKRLKTQIEMTEKRASSTRNYPCML